MRIFISIKFYFSQTCHTGLCTLAHNLERTSKLKALVLWFIVLAFVLIGQQARACTINFTGVNFGSYDVFSNAEQHGVGNIDVNCDIHIGYTIALGASNGSFTQRVLRSGTHSLNYNLFTASNRALVWGDATNGTATVSGSGTGNSLNHVVYGHIPPRQIVYPGSYSDTITVVITF